MDREIHCWGVYVFRSFNRNYNIFFGIFFSGKRVLGGMCVSGVGEGGGGGGWRYRGDGGWGKES